MSQNIRHYPKLSIDLDRGLLISAEGEERRLSPINLKVLSAVLTQAPNLVSRNALFEQAWPNQIVSDDTLNRCISDIRSQLSRLSPETKYIETTPKRGYRWIASPIQQQSESEETDPQETGPQETGPQETEPEAALNSEPGDSTSVIAKSPTMQKKLFENIAIVGALSFILILAISAIVPSFVKPENAPLVLLFDSKTSEDLARSQANFNKILRGELGKNPYLSLISNSATSTSPKSPYPYFHQEYKAKWIIEIQLLKLGNEIDIRADIVDARTGIIQASLQELKPWPIQEKIVWNSMSYSIHTALKKLN